MPELLLRDRSRAKTVGVGALVCLTVANRAFWNCVPDCVSHFSVCRTEISKSSMSNPFEKAARSALKRANLALHRVGYKIVATSAGETSAGERSRLESWPRYRRTTTNLIGATITIIDSASFLWQYED